MSKGQKDRWTETYARAVLEHADRRKLGDTALARELGVSPQRIHWWRKRLRGAPVPPQPGFVAVKLAAPAAQPFTLRTRRGHTIEARAEAEAGEGAARPVSAVVEKYELWLRHERGNRPSTVTTTLYRLRALLGPIWNEPARAISVARAAALYAQRSAAVVVDTHRNELGQVKTFWKWAEKRKLVRRGVWEEVEPVGQRNTGKAQLRLTEARLLYGAALAEASSPSSSGMGVRRSRTGTTRCRRRAMGPRCGGSPRRSMWRSRSPMGVGNK